MQTESTKKIYQYYVNRFYDKKKVLTPNKFFREISDLNNKKGKEMTISTIKLIISSIIWQLRKEKASEKIIQHYSKLIKELKSEAKYQEQDHNKYEGFIPDWKDIIKIRDQTEDPLDHLILSLYTYIPPRRLKDFLMMKITNNVGSKENRGFNYYDMQEKTFTFNVYKTQKAFKGQTFDVPDELCNIIDDYIKLKKLKSGSLLLGLKNYFQLGYRLRKLLKCSCDNIRHSFVNHEYTNVKNMPESSRMEEVAREMGHSLETHLRYRKNT